MSDLSDRSRQSGWVALPDELKERRQWLVWRYDARPGKNKPAKRPYAPGTGRPARTDAPATWGTFPQALARFQHGGWQGLGFVFTGNDPYCGVDLDYCHDPQTGKIAAWAQLIVAQLASYTEISPSGRGLHILVRAALPQHCGRKHDAVEVYDTRRYFSITGKRLAGTPATLEVRQTEVLVLYASLAPEVSAIHPRAVLPHQTPTHSDAEVLARAAAAANGATFRALWSGKLSAYRDQQTGLVDQSRADFVLCLLLAYWTAGNAEQMDLLFRQSALYRSKWDTQWSGGGRTYGQVTIWNALRWMERQRDIAPPKRIL